MRLNSCDFLGVIECLRYDSKFDTVNSFLAMKFTTEPSQFIYLEAYYYKYLSVIQLVHSICSKTRTDDQDRSSEYVTQPDMVDDPVELISSTDAPNRPEFLYGGETDEWVDQPLTIVQTYTSPEYSIANQLFLL